MQDTFSPPGSIDSDGLKLRFVTPEEIFGGVLLVCATVLAGVQVTSRTLLGDTFIWAEEAVVVMVIWSVFFGASAVTYRRMHIRMDILAVSVKSRWRPAIEILASLICVGYVVTALVLGFQFLQFLRGSGETNPSMLIPQWILYLGFPLGMICVLIRTLQDLLRHIRTLRGPSV
jgi:TRAP-type C4-dicarboxylate transport system permease small subunit